jgi:hypothetical protein
MVGSAQIWSTAVEYSLKRARAWAAAGLARGRDCAGMRVRKQ